MGIPSVGISDLVFGVRELLADGVEKPIRARLNLINAVITDDAINGWLTVTLGSLKAAAAAVIQSATGSIEYRDASDVVARVDTLDADGASSTKWKNTVTSATYFVETSPAATAGKPLAIAAGNAGVTGARTVGGALTLSAGDSGGDSGTGVIGGELLLAAGDGSTNNGDGGIARLRCGARNGSGAAGRVQLEAPNGDAILTVTELGVVTIGETGEEPVHRVNGKTQTTVGAAGAADNTPSKPEKYLVVNVGGTEYVLPLYLKS